MRILYFYQYFATSEGAWGTRVYEFARHWIAAGHEVTVITSVYAKSDLVPGGWISKKNVEGIDLRIINIRIDNKQPKFKRISTFIQYAIISSWYALTMKADVVIVSSGPITVGIPGLVARWIRGRKFAFEARDLWPEGAVKLNLLKGSTAVSLAYLFEKICYNSAHVIVGLSPGIQRDIQKRFPSVRVECITNAANLSLFSDLVARPLNLPVGAYAIYFGNLGEVNHSHYLLDAASILLKNKRSDIWIVLIGDGPLKSELKARVSDEELVNVLMYELMAKTTLVGYIQHALAAVIPLKPIPVFDTSSPNKLFESMAAGIPVIQTTQGWIKDFLADHDVGFTVDGNDPQMLVEKLVYLKDNPGLAEAIGARGKVVAARFFDKDYLAGNMLGILKSVHES
ncbi:MAG: glycosyltransferase family 4 protein [Cytophagales bacterium]|nr:glycosyltransferase family 4 protein [Cytophagales bacterium]